jgi:3-oxoacyl-[acyl-carrier-protein] synthase II
VATNAEYAVITGMGAVSPHGKTVGTLWSNLLEGKPAFKPLTALFNASDFRNPLAGVVDGYPVSSDANQPARAVRMLDDALGEALRDALGLPADSTDAVLRETISKSGLRQADLVTSTNFGGMSVTEHALIEGASNTARASLDGYLMGPAANHVAGHYGIGGSQFNLSLACSSGAAAIGIALDLIRRGRADIAIACGYDELSLYIYAGLSALRAITPETIRPFDKRRKGTLFSEGAGVMVLENPAHAAERKAPNIYGRVLGRAMNNDAYHMTAPEQEAHGIQAVMRAALRDAGVAPAEIDHLNLHATGTPYNDAIETKAVHAVFGSRGREIPVCSVKSSIGHTMGAAGVLESIVAVMTMREGKVPPVLGLDPQEKDPQCDLNPAIGKPLLGTFNKVLKTSYGFGGTNAAVVIARN